MIKQQTQLVNSFFFKGKHNVSSLDFMLNDLFSDSSLSASSLTVDRKASLELLKGKGFLLCKLGCQNLALIKHNFALW